MISEITRLDHRLPEEKYTPDLNRVSTDRDAVSRLSSSRSAMAQEVARRAFLAGFGACIAGAGVVGRLWLDAARLKIRPQPDVGVLFYALGEGAAWERAS